jgi:hypothetical protein
MPLLYNQGMSGNEQAAEPIPAPPAATADKMNIQCTHCGHVQELDPEYKICLNCGSAVAETDYLILKNPRKGRGMQGMATLSFFLFLFIFFFWSKYIGRHGMAISALFVIWGFYRNYLHKRDAEEAHAHQR